MYKYVIEKGGVSHEERGYLRSKDWVSLYRARKFKSEQDAISAYKASDLVGGVLIRTDKEFDTWKTLYTI